MTAQPGTLVRYREREWVVMPSADPNVVLLRPIGGSAREVCGVYLPLAEQIAPTLPFEQVTPAQFPLPNPATVKDAAAVRLPLAAARLLLREGAAPFRSLGHISVRPRTYQLVPLVMALRQKTVRLLIADDVGVGKTIEAGLIARELLDRGEVQRLGVLCPPYLCEQWQKELREKFHLDAVVIRAGTVARLERQTPPDRSIFAHFPCFVASIDLVKGDRYRASFIEHCPELLLVDEVHGAAQPPMGRSSHGQQQRHELLKKLARDPNRHLLLLTATPHSGVEESFLSILGLLQSRFQALDLANLSEPELRELTRCFVQRRRADVEQWSGEATPFPQRDPSEQPYRFSSAYRKFYEAVYEYARGQVTEAEKMTGWKRRIRFWSALALLRCVASSPAAAEAALLKRAGSEEATPPIPLDDSTTVEEVDGLSAPLVTDPAEVEVASDAPPGSVFEAQEQDPAWSERDRRRLREFARQAHALRGEADTKMQKAAEVVAGMLQARRRPIIWCRYIATADAVAEELQRRLGTQFPGLRVAAITGLLGEEERRLKVDDLAQSPQRVLVATDCLSEGINLQEHFDAVVHYDLPWNPNRLEQREGRVDRFGQLAPTVQVVLIYGQDNPVDGAVWEVLLRKAEEIRQSLGVYVPVPIDSESVMEAVLHSLFFRAQHKKEGRQMPLWPEDDPAGQAVGQLHAHWDRSAEREKASRTRFAQHAIQPEEVQRELRATDTILGNSEAVRAFLSEAAQRLSFSMHQSKDRWLLSPSTLPPAVRQRLGTVPDPWPITFDSPTPTGLTYIGRNHPLIEVLAEYLLDLAFHPLPNIDISRCGVLATDQVPERTILLLLRPRYLQHERGDRAPLLAEETLVWGFRGQPPQIRPIPPEEAQQLLDQARPSANVPLPDKQAALAQALSWWDDLQPRLQNMLETRATHLAEAHRRVRQLLSQRGARLEAQMPPDLLGLVVLLPAGKEGRR